MFDPLINGKLFYRVQGVLSGRAIVTAPQLRAHPDFPLRGFVRFHRVSARSPAAGRACAALAQLLHGCLARDAVLSRDLT